MKSILFFVVLALCVNIPTAKAQVGFFSLSFRLE